MKEMNAVIIFLAGFLGGYLWDCALTLDEESRTGNRWATFIVIAVLLYTAVLLKYYGNK